MSPKNLGYNDSMIEQIKLLNSTERFFRNFDEYHWTMLRLEGIIIYNVVLRECKPCRISYIFYQLIWPWMKVTENGMLWNTLSQATAVLAFVIVVMIVSEKIPTFIRFSISHWDRYLYEGQRNWHDLNILATKYLCAELHDCQNVYFYPDLPSAPITMTLNEGH